MDKNFKDKNNPVYQLGKAVHDNDIGKMHQLLSQHPVSTFQPKTYQGNLHSPLHIAAQEGNKEALGLLLESGFDIDHSYSNVSSHTALSFSKDEQIKNYLISMDASNPSEDIQPT